MDNEQLRDFSERQAELVRTIRQIEPLVEALDVPHSVERLRELREKTASDTFKIMVVGAFKTGKSTLINALLGEEVLPAFATPTTAIINEVKYGERPRAVLHFLNPQPERLYDGVPERALEHIRAHAGENIPPLELPVDEIEDYVVIPMGMEHDEASRQSPFSRVELFWPLDILRDGVEIIDSPGLRENPARTAVTMGYLSQADTVIFAVSALSAGSKDETDFLSETLPIYGITEQNLFCVVNRINQVRNDRERTRVMKFVDDLMKPFTKRIFYVNALDALDGRLDGDAEKVEASNIPALERDLTSYLANDRGKVKLATPARECVRSLRHDLLEGVIPQRRRALSMDLSELKRRYADARPEVERLEQQIGLLTAKADALIAGMEPQIRHFAEDHFSELPGRVREWVDEYEPKTEGRPLHVSEDAERLAEELEDHLTQKIDADSRLWASEAFAKLVEDSAEEMKARLQADVDDFYISLDQLKLDITNASEVKAGEIPTWQRVVAGVAGTVLLSPYADLISASTDLGVDLLKGMGITVAAGIALSFLGVGVPIALLIASGATSVLTLALSGEKALKQVKDSVANEYCNSIERQADELVAAAVSAALDALGTIKEAVTGSLSTELNEMQRQMESIIVEMEQGKENVRRQCVLLDECESRLRETADGLDTFIFELAKDG